MSALKDDALMIGAGVVLLIIAAAYLKNHATDVVEAIPQAAADTVAAGVIGTGEVLGIPQTNVDQCSQDIAAKDKWNASFDCPAGTFLNHVFD